MGGAHGSGPSDLNPTGNSRGFLEGRGRGMEWPQTMPFLSAMLRALLNAVTLDPAEYGVPLPCHAALALRDHLQSSWEAAEKAG